MSQSSQTFQIQKHTIRNLPRPSLCSAQAALGEISQVNMLQAELSTLRSRSGLVSNPLVPRKRTLLLSSIRTKCLFKKRREFLLFPANMQQWLLRVLLLFPQCFLQTNELAVSTDGVNFLFPPHSLEDSRSAIFSRSQFTSQLKRANQCSLCSLLRMPKLSMHDLSKTTRLCGLRQSQLELLRIEK
jgi:hypothetical protein